MKKESLGYKEIIERNLKDGDILHLVCDFVDILKEVDTRMPVVVLDKDGNEGKLVADFIDDGREWQKFSFVLKYGDRYNEYARVADTDVLKFILDYCLNDKTRKPSFFSDDQLGGYSIVLTWNEDNCWRETDILHARINPYERRFEILVNELPSEEKEENRDGD